MGRRIWRRIRGWRLRLVRRRWSRFGGCLGLRIGLGCECSALTFSEGLEDGFADVVVLFSSESLLRRALFEDTGGMYPELITRPDIKVFLPPIGGLTVYICTFFLPSRYHFHAFVCAPRLKETFDLFIQSALPNTCTTRPRSSPSVCTTNVRPFTHCFLPPCLFLPHSYIFLIPCMSTGNGSDVFGSDICTCKPYLTFAIEECIRTAQRGGVGVVVYFRKEGRALGEVTKCVPFYLSLSTLTSFTVR